MWINTGPRYRTTGKTALSGSCPLYTLKEAAVKLDRPELARTGIHQLLGFPSSVRGRGSKGADACRYRLKDLINWLKENEMQLKIEKGVPLPKTYGMAPSNFTPTLSAMEVGDSFECPAAGSPALYVAIRKAQQGSPDKKFVTRKDGDQRRVWRTA